MGPDAWGALERAHDELRSAGTTRLLPPPFGALDSAFLALAARQTVMTRRPDHRERGPRSRERQRTPSVPGPFDGADIVRMLERQGFQVADEDVTPGAWVYRHEDGRVVVTQPSLPACVRLGDRTFNLLAHDMNVSAAVLARMLEAGRDRPS